MGSGNCSLGFRPDPMKTIIIINRGGLRNNLPQGEITVGNMFEVMPFDNEITVIGITGKQLKECINAMLTQKKLISYNLKMELKENKPSKIMFTNLNTDDFNGAYDLNDPYFLKKYYYVITTDYLANGGDNCTFFTDPVPPNYSNTKVKLRDAMIQYCKDLTEKNIHLQPIRFGNVRISK
jgi:2',3'-cyclic-nucleotide 2'-phosphodiesterase (5'-nucleotidase family)